MKKIAKLIIWTTLFALLSCAPPTEKQTEKFKQVGYCKQDRSRVFAIEYLRGVTTKEVHEHGEERMHTSGRITIVNFYPNGTDMPRDRLTLCRSLEDGMQAAAYWKPCYQVWINPQGASRFSDYSENAKCK